MNKRCALSKPMEEVKVMKKINQSKNREEKNVHIIYQMRDKYKVQNNLVKVNSNIRNYYKY